MFQAHHIPGKNNVLADHLSRLQTAKFRQLEGQLQNLNPFQKSLKQLMETSLAPSTKVTYKRAWSLYSKFAHDHSLNPDLPVSMSNLDLFISFLVRKPYKPATISNGQQFHHTYQQPGMPTKYKGARTPQQLFSSKSSCSHADQTFDTRLPIDKIMLHQLTTALCYTITGAYRHTLFQAMFLLAFHVFLRIGEITVQNSAYKHPHLIMLHQLQSLPNQLMINFLFFKHSSGQPFLLKIKADKNPFTVQSKAWVGICGWEVISQVLCFSTHTTCQWHEVNFTKNWERRWYFAESMVWTSNFSGHWDHSYSHSSG